MSDLILLLTLFYLSQLLITNPHNDFIDWTKDIQGH